MRSGDDVTSMTAEGSLESEGEEEVHSTAGGVVTGCRRLPDVASLDHERRLQGIATAGGGGDPWSFGH